MFLPDHSNPEIIKDLPITYCILVDASTAIMLDESICHFRGFGFICHFYSFFDGKILTANNVDPDKMPHYVVSDLVLHCLPMTLLQVSR